MGYFVYIYLLFLLFFLIYFLFAKIFEITLINSFIRINGMKLKNMEKKPVPYDVAKKRMAKDTAYLIREIRPLPCQLMLEPFPLAGQPKGFDGWKLDGVAGKCANPWRARGEIGIMLNGDEIAEYVPALGRLLDFGSHTGLLDGMGKRMLVQGGHFIPDLRNGTVSFGATYGLGIALKAIEVAWNRGKRADLFVLINDLQMGERSENRAEYYEEFRLPKGMQGMIAACKERTKRDFLVLVAGESYLSNHMQKYVLPKTGEASKPEASKIMLKNAAPNERGQVRCRAAIAMLHLLASRFYEGLVQVYPICGRNHATDAFNVFRDVFGKEVSPGFNVLNILAGKGCWGSGQVNTGAAEKAEEVLHELLNIL